MAATDRRAGDAGTRTVAVVLVAASAIGLGLAVSGDAILGGTGTSATPGDAWPRAAVGLAVGCAVAALAVVALRSSSRVPRLVWADIALAVVVAGCVGALLGAASTPNPPGAASDISTVEASAIGDVAYRPTTGASASGVVSPLDLDGDGRADAVDSRPVLAFDTDGDGVEDGRLRPCTRALDAPVPDRSIAVDGNCGSVAELFLPYDPSIVLMPADTPARPPAPSRERSDVGVSDTQGTVVLVGALALLLLAIRFFATRIDSVPIEADQLYLDADDFIDDDDDSDEPDGEAVSAALRGSLGSLLDPDDPRDAIVAAYVRLLDELDAIGLGRRRWEAPMEHCHRCLREAHVADAAIETLVELFSRARFGGRPMTEADRDAARRALIGSIAALDRSSVVTT